jgi:SprT protein
MPKQEAPLEYLQRYLPSASAPLVLQYLHHYKVHLTITRERKSILGDYRHATHDRNHRISVNGNLNKYSFLITLVHELAHLLTFQQWGNRVQSHGKEWKNIYAFLLKDFLSANLFPDDIRLALQQSIHDLPASSCADDNLMRVLRKYDENPNNVVLVEQIPEGNCFALDDGRIFKKGKKLRKRYQCFDVKTKQEYLFSPVYEVKRAI